MTKVFADEVAHWTKSHSSLELLESLREDLGMLEVSSGSTITIVGDGEHIISDVSHQISASLEAIDALKERLATDLEKEV